VKQQMKILTTIANNLHFSLHMKVVSLAVISTLVAACLVGIIMIQNSRKALHDGILDNHLAIARIMADFSANYIDSAKSNAHQLAMCRLFIQAVLAHDIKQAEWNLSQLLQIDKRFDSTSLYTTSGINLIDARNGVLIITH
jgi:hypothetical protein